MSLVEFAKPGWVEVRKMANGYSVFRDGLPYRVNGAGGFAHVGSLVDYGGNSIRTWSFDQTELVLPAVRESGLTLCSGLWLEQPRKGFDYKDQVSVSRQSDMLKKQINLLKGEESLLLWGIGNELELGMEDHGYDAWPAVEELAQYIKRIDPSHPTMTVISSPCIEILNIINEFCPSIDVLGINAYGDIATVRPTLEAAGWTKPFLITEWGSDGSWEVRKTQWGAPIEPSSSEKARQVDDRFNIIDEMGDDCLGSYAFLWGSKQETTETWYSLFDDDGRRYETVDTLSHRWNKNLETKPRVRVGELRMQGKLPEGNLSAHPNQKLKAEFRLEDIHSTSFDVKWVLRYESNDRQEGGDFERRPESVDTDFISLEMGTVAFEAPQDEGFYRLYLFVTGLDDDVSCANFPFEVKA